jgi:hypothetical protein
VAISDWPASRRTVSIILTGCLTCSAIVIYSLQKLKL